MADIYNPRVVGEYNHPDSRLHDVWVHDGIAYSAEWEKGMVAVDVGNGRWGGTPENPVLIAELAVPTGTTHAIFPYRSQSTDRFYVFLGDENMQRRGLANEGPRMGGSYQLPYDPETGMNGVPLATQGYIQVVDFTDPDNPEMVARYEVTEYGTHNIWVEDDILYQAYYEGGLRVVDVSGELMGNLYTQGREISVHKSTDVNGWVPNSTMVWSAMPFKGTRLLLRHQLRVVVGEGGAAPAAGVVGAAGRKKSLDRATPAGLRDDDRGTHAIPCACPRRDP